MILIFLVLLALLAWAILCELERLREPASAPMGNCPGCTGIVELDWLLCPRCRTLLQESCPGCGRPRSTFHRFCPGCGKGKGDS